MHKVVTYFHILSYILVLKKKNNKRLIKTGTGRKTSNYLFQFFKKIEKQFVILVEIKDWD